MGLEETMGGYASRLEAERFVGRDDVLAVAAGVLRGGSAQRIVYLHGPGGVGKSALLRTIESQVRSDGRPVVRIDGRLVGATRRDLRQALAPVCEDSVILCDEIDELAALRVELRDAVLEMVPASGRVVLAGRAAPDRIWFDGVLQTITVAVPVRPLTRDASRDLLARQGVPAADIDSLVDWAAGYPLALTLTAALPASTSPPHPSSSPKPQANDDGSHSFLDALLLERLGGSELIGVDPDLLDVASIAPTVDGPLLASVLPGRPTREGTKALRALSIAEPIGRRSTLHPLARSALRTRLRRTDPERHRTLVVRIAAHLHRRALAGDADAALELASLVEEPELRLGAERSTTFYGDVPRPGDLEAMTAATGAGRSAWFERLTRWCDERPGQAIAVRRVDGTLIGMSVVCMARDVPAWAEDHIETGPVLTWLEARGMLDDAALTHDTVLLDPTLDPVTRAEVVRVGNAATMAMGAVRNPRYVVATASTSTDHRRIAPLHYEPIEELRRSDAERELITRWTDFGPGGIVGQMYRLVLAEQGQAVPEAGLGSPVGGAVVAALRQFHDDDALSASVLASVEGTTAERADAAREAVRSAVDAAFDGSSEDQELRLAIVRAYLDPDGGHGIAQRELNMSRSSFYRFLQKARYRLLSDT
ncbi:MAG TPA: ATP-binding protein [Acidimicrobiales bacterium]|nr:ATP-binding protein [Acidimicrobiales bacterium]